MTKSSDEELEDLEKQLEEARKKNEILKKKKQLEELQKQNEELEKPSPVTKSNIPAPQQEVKGNKKEKSLVEQFEKLLSEGRIQSAKELAKNPEFTVEQRLNLMNSVKRAFPNDRKNREELKDILRDNIDFTKEKSAPSEDLEIRILQQPYSVCQKYLNPETNPNLKLSLPIIRALNNSGEFMSVYNSRPTDLSRDWLTLMRQVFLAKEFAVDRNIAYAIRNFHPSWLRSYVDKIIQQDEKNKNFQFEFEAFCILDNKGTYNYNITAEEYQKKRDGIKIAISEGKSFEDIKKILGKPWIKEKYEYILKEAKAQDKMSLFKEVASEFLAKDYKKLKKSDVKNIKFIGSILKFGQDDADLSHEKVFAELLHEKGVTAKLIKNVMDGESYRAYNTINCLKIHEPYLELKEALGKFGNIDKNNTKELNKAQKQIDIAIDKMVKAKSPVYLIEEVASNVKDPEQKQKMLMDYAKAVNSIYLGSFGFKGPKKSILTPEAYGKFVETNLLTTDDKVKNAEIILELARNIKSEGIFAESSKANVDAPKLKELENLYNKKVLGGKSPQELGAVNEMFEKLPPKDLGKLLFRETYKEDSVKDLPQKSSVKELIKGGDVGKLDKAVALLQANTGKKEGGLPALSEEQKQEATKNLVSNLSFKQMSKVVEAVEGYEDYSKKNWLSKALTKFADGLCRRFSKLKTAGVENGVKELMEKGAGVKVETKDLKKMNVVTKIEGMGL